MQNLKVDDLVKKQVSDMLKAAANPDHGKIDVIVKSLPKERRTMIGETAKAARQTTKAVTRRGRSGLEGMDDAEWAKLVEDE